MMPGGAIKPIPGNVERAIRTAVPNADWTSLKFAAEQYQLESEHDGQAPAKVRDALSGIVERAVHLRCDLLMLKEESRDAIGDWSLIEATAAQLQRLIGASKAGHNAAEPKDGRPVSLRRGFVRTIAGILRRGGYDADSRPNGALVYVTRELLGVYGDQPADMPSLVRGAMRENPREAE